MRHRHRAEQHAINYTEDSGVDRHPETQSYHGDDREYWRVTKRSRGVAPVLPEISNRACANTLPSSGSMQAFLPAKVLSKAYVISELRGTSEFERAGEASILGYMVAESNTKPLECVEMKGG